MSDSWARYVPTASSPWDLARVKLLHRRAGFGATWAEIQRDLADGPDASVTRVLSGASRLDGQREDFDSMSRIIGDAAQASDDANRLKAWWLFRIFFTPHPLQEKLTLTWHNHFATSNLKVNDLQLMKAQNEVLRRHALGNFGDLLSQVVRGPAMLVWLDANSNRKGQPNENLARELLELFTLGVGNYSEQDVKETARAFTGWTVKRREASFEPDLHDSSSKTILGTTQNFDTDSLIKLLLADPATSRRIAWRLCETFMGENSFDQKAVDELSLGLREHAFDIAWAVETILRSELFNADENIGSKVSSPVEFVMSNVRALELLSEPPSTLILAEWCSRIGQDLFFPPNVGGWSGSRNWLNSRTIVGRSNFAVALINGELRLPHVSPNLDELFGKYKQQTDSNSLTMQMFFQELLLSQPLRPEAEEQFVDAGQYVASLLSCPQACLI